MSNGRPMNSVISWFRRSSQYFTDQPPWANPPLGSSSGPPGACITPSSVRNVVTLSLRIPCPPPNTASNQKCTDRTDRDDADANGSASSCRLDLHHGANARGLLTSVRQYMQRGWRTREHRHIPAESVEPRCHTGCGDPDRFRSHSAALEECDGDQV